jgi:hypothetical protein
VSIVFIVRIILPLPPLFLKAPLLLRPLERFPLLPSVLALFFLGLLLVNDVNDTSYKLYDTKNKSSFAYGLVLRVTLLLISRPLIIGALTCAPRVHRR